MDNKVLNREPNNIATFLFDNSELKTEKVGEYLGNLKNQDVLYSYLENHHNFHSLPIDIALRKFLFNFRLPGEAQQIDRIMEMFAQKYYKTNPDTDHFENAGYFY